MNRRRRGSSLLMSVGHFIAFGCTQGGGPPKIGDLSPRIELSDLKGNRVVVPDDLRHKIVIVRFWRDCCSYNINEMSQVEQIYRKFEGRGIEIVTIHTGATRKIAQDFVSMLKIKFPVLLDPDSKIARRYGVSEPPCTFILDRNGVIKTKITGLLEEPVGPTYEKLITALLN